MNEIVLKGVIQNIQHSHTISNIDYDRAEITVPGIKPCTLQLRFKHYSNKYEDGQEISLIGNIRSYSEKINENKNKVHLYVFTYFDQPEEDVDNNFIVDGRICKIDSLRKSMSGNYNIHFILANNIISKASHQKLNTYIPMVAFGKVAEEIAKLQVSDQIQVTGRLNSREYTKRLESGKEETRIAYEGIVNEFTIL